MEQTKVIEQKKRKKKVYHPKNPNKSPTIYIHPFDYPDEYLLETYNLNRAAIQELLYIVGPHIDSGQGYRMERKLAAALYYYRTGTPLKDIGEIFNWRLHKPDVIRGVEEITIQMDKHAADVFINIPHTTELQDIVHQRYLTTTGLSSILGSIGCFHIKIRKPSFKMNSNEYWNSHGFHSKHVQIICDFDMNILGCFARHGGSYNEKEVWKKSLVRKYMQRLHEENLNECFLVASSMYPEEPWLLTPISDLTTNAHNFNESHEKAHLPVRRLIAMLKEEFGCLSRGLCVHPGYAGAIINCCCALHNLRKKHNLPMPNVQDDNLDEIEKSFLTKAKILKPCRNSP